MNSFVHNFTNCPEKFLRLRSEQLYNHAILNIQRPEIESKVIEIIEDFEGINSTRVLHWLKHQWFVDFMCKKVVSVDSC